MKKFYKFRTRPMVCRQRDSSNPRAATVIALIRLDRYSDTSESSLGAQPILLVLSFTVLYAILGNPGVIHSVPTAVGTEWITPWLPRMSNTHAYCFY